MHFLHIPTFSGFPKPAPWALPLDPCSVLLVSHAMGQGSRFAVLDSWGLLAVRVAWFAVRVSCRMIRDAWFAVRVAWFVLTVHAPQRVSEYPPTTGPKKRAGSLAARALALFYTVGFT